MEEDIIKIIKNKMMAEFTYNDKTRIGAICKLGYTKDRDLGITFYQTSGESNNTLPEWRSMKLDKITNLKVRNDLTWTLVSPSKNGENNFIDDSDVICEIDY